MNKRVKKLSVRWWVRHGPPGLPSFLAREEPFQYGADLGHVRGGDLPDDLQIYVRVVMSHDVPHAAYFSKGEFGDGLPGRRSQMSHGLADDLNASDNGVLFLLVSAEIGLSRVSDV